MAGPGSRSYEADYDITRSVSLCAQENDNETLNYGGSGKGEMDRERRMSTRRQDEMSWGHIRMS
jgi:hypothetical protein